MQVTHPSTVITGVVLPRRTAVTIVLMFGFALLTAAAAQIAVPLPFTPVPITGQTFAVLLAGAALGSWAGAGSQLIYIMLGAAGLPFYAEARGGWGVFTGATFGYLVGFVVAAWIVGAMAQRKQDRNVWSAVPAFLTGNAVILLCGVSWLYIGYAPITTWEGALVNGFLPFVVGDLLKIAVAGLLLPAAWKLTSAAKR
jgi:biotin transport system substrate-specific component